jgi:hypothetical protein
MRSRATHPLLCSAQNPASIHLLTFARKNEWLAVHALAQCTSRILLDHQQGRVDDLKSDWEVVKGLAVLGMEERFKDIGYVISGCDKIILMLKIIVGNLTK